MVLCLCSARFRSASACNLIIADMHTSEYAINRSMYSKWIPNVFIAEKAAITPPAMGDAVADHHHANASFHENGCTLHGEGGGVASPHHHVQDEPDEQRRTIRVLSVSTSPRSLSTSAATSEAVATSCDIAHASESHAIAVGDCFEYKWDDTFGAIHVEYKGRATQHSVGPPF